MMIKYDTDMNSFLIMDIHQKNKHDSLKLAL
jgi:hypothetical protein